MSIDDFKKIVKSIPLVIFLLIAASANVFGQTTNGFQLWTEYHHNHSFANVYSLDNRLRYSTNFESPKFRGLQWAPNLQRSFTKNVDAFVMMVLNYNHQNDTTTTFEIRPALGMQLHLTPNKRILTSVRLMFEQRNLQNPERDDWQHSTRFRARPQAVVPLGHHSYFEDGSIYLIADVEWFIIMDQDVGERYADRLRARGGIGYRLSPQWRFELIYTQQRSRITLGDSYKFSDNILRLNVRYYTKRGKSKSTDPN